jgi:hypothetical protein
VIVTDKVIYIHMPKTGGTFTTEVLGRLHALPAARPVRVARGVRRRLSGREFPSSWLKYGPLADLEPKHGTCHDIPEEHRGKAIFSTLRNPLDWYVSQYEFGWWKRTFVYHPEKYPTPAGHAIEQALPAFQAAHRHFPDVSFSEFFDLCCLAAATYDVAGAPSVGLYTHSILRFYFRDPVRALRSLDEAYAASGRWRSDVFDVEFVFMHDLPRQLDRRLRRYGYAPRDLRFIRSLGRVLPEGRGRTDDQDWRSYYDEHLLSRVREADWLAFGMFPALAV